MNRLLLLALALCGISASAQINITPRGTDATLDVATWNVEFFGDDDRQPNDAVQLDRVEAVIAQSQIDLWGFQEIVDETDWNALLERIEDDGYDGYLAPAAFSGSQRLAFVWDTTVLSNVSTSVLFENVSGASFDFASRLPVELRATVTVGGMAKTVRFIVIHAKAFDDPDSYNRRAGAARTLKSYTDNLEAQGVPVVVLGDFNDMLIGSIRGSTFSSPYQAFVTDPDYTAATLTTEQAGLATFCGSGTSDDSMACNGEGPNASTIDHILFTTATLTFVPAQDNPQFQRYGELLPVFGEDQDGDGRPDLVSGITQYTLTTSDHLPALANLTLEAPVAGEAAPEAGAVALLAPAPNPFRGGTQLRFRLGAPGSVQLDVFDALGRRVASLAGAFGAGEHPVSIDGDALAPGTYIVRLMASGQIRTQLMVRAE